MSESISKSHKRFKLKQNKVCEVCGSKWQLEKFRGKVLCGICLISDNGDPDYYKKGLERIVDRRHESGLSRAADYAMSKTKRK